MPITQDQSDSGSSLTVRSRPKSVALCLLQAASVYFSSEGSKLGAAESRGSKLICSACETYMRPANGIRVSANAELIPVYSGLSGFAQHVRHA